MDKKIVSRIKYCLPDDCDNTPTKEIEVGNEFHIYCCEKGFLQAMDEFTSSPFKEPHIITDEIIAPKENVTNNLNQLLLIIIGRI
jgi:hypothetical protein